MSPFVSGHFTLRDGGIAASSEWQRPEGDTVTITSEHWSSLHDRTVYDRDGDRVGTVGQVWAGASGVEAEWISVRTGLFGLRDTLIPLASAEWRDGELYVPYDKSTIKGAPRIETEDDEPLDAEGVRRLYEYYAGTGVAVGRHHDAGRNSAADRNSDPGRNDYADRDPGAGRDAMTRSEERLDVGTERHAAGTARLRKYVVTENVRTTVPVQREKVRLEREPITDANLDAAYDGPDIGEAEHEVTLHAERPVVRTDTVPVERVRLGTETVEEQETVSGQVRKERIESDLPDRRH
jgi:uncharacterized protein (TIGR02271 family)